MVSSVCPLEIRQLLALQVCHENTVGIWDAQQEILPAFRQASSVALSHLQRLLGSLEDAQLSPGTASSALGGIELCLGCYLCLNFVLC